VQHRYTEEQIPHLANGVYQALRNGWRTQSSNLSPSPHSSVSTGRIPQPETASNIIINSQAAMRVLPPHDHTGPAGHTAILIDAPMYQDFLAELLPEHEQQWHEAITDESSIYTIWRYRTDREQWRPHPALPGSVPETGLKLAKFLLTAGLIWPISSAQMQEYTKALDLLDGPRSPVDIIREAAEAALG